MIVSKAILSIIAYVFAILLGAVVSDASKEVPVKETKVRMILFVIFLFFVVNEISVFL